MGELKSGTGLPVEGLAGRIVDSMRGSGSLVLHAPTGSGKSTKVPQILLDSGVCSDGRLILVLQPRRLPARMLARRVAFERGGKLGEEVGYHIRFSRASGKNTRILFITEGVLLRMFQSDPLLSDVGIIVFDEFHERHLQSDLGLGLACSLKRDRRPELGICVMSATLETRAIVEFMEPCDLVQTDTRTYPVEISHPPSRWFEGGDRIWELAARAFEMAVPSSAGHMLVFMPGVYEIQRTVDAIRRCRAARDFRILPLHGRLSPEDQDAAVDDTGHRKVVVATNVAETSLTIDGVDTVIDSGLVRMPGYDSRRGINTLLVQNTDRAACDQRSGRAGRTGPGRCIRLWTKNSHGQRPQESLPEVLRVDLSEAALFLKSLGWKKLLDFPWLDRPIPEALDRALLLLDDLGAIDADGELTKLGAAMASLPLHPRLSRMLLEGASLGCVELAARCAALCQGRPILLAIRDKRLASERAEMVSAGDSDIILALELWRKAREDGYPPEWCRRWGIHMQAAREADEVAESLMSLMGGARAGDSADKTADLDYAQRLKRCLLAGFPDHVGSSDHPGNHIYHLVHGRKARLDAQSMATGGKLLVATDINEIQKAGSVQTTISMASALDLNTLRDLFPDDFAEDVVTVWDEGRREAVARKRTIFRDLVIEDAPANQLDAEMASRLLAERVLSGEIPLKRWDHDVENWIRRVQFVASECPELGIAAIDKEAREMLVRQICDGAKSAREIRDREVMRTVKSWLSKADAAAVESAAPESISIRERKRPLKIRYEPENGQAIISAKLQDFYDVPHASLMICHGRKRLTVELLAPNGRPAQTTDDLDGFWKSSYENVKKELKGRYPKHEWR